MTLQCVDRRAQLQYLPGQAQLRQYGKTGGLQKKTRTHRLGLGKAFENPDGVAIPMQKERGGESRRPRPTYRN